MVLFCAFSTMQGQSWLTDGQVWHYKVQGGWIPGNYGIHTLEITGDTIIQNIPCKIVTHYPIVTQPSHRYAYSSQHRVYYYDSFDDVFWKMYDFGLQTGDTLAMKFKKYRIDSTGVMNIGGTNVQYQYITFFGDNWSDGGYLVLEGIGLAGRPIENDTTVCSYFFPDENFCASGLDGWNILFRCFSDETIFYNPFETCNPTSITGVFEKNIKLYPNPVANWLTLESAAGMAANWVVLYDLQGRAVWQGRPAGAGIDVRNSPPGLYILKAWWKDGEFYFGKVVIQARKK